MTAEQFPHATAIGTESGHGYDFLGMIARVADRQEIDLLKIVTGIESSGEILEVSQSEIKRRGPTLVDFVAQASSFSPLENQVDIARPSVIDKNGKQFTAESVLDVWRHHVAPLAEVVILNHQEASAILNRTVETSSQLSDAAKALVDLGCRASLVTGGHLDGIVRDFCFDGADVYEFGADQIRYSKKVFGAGAAHASFVLCGLAGEMDMLSSIDRARREISVAILNAREIENGVVVCPTISQ